MAKKYYAVKVGKEPGVYLTWDACKAMVDGYPGAKYKSFPTLEEAEEFAGVKTGGEQLTIPGMELTASKVASKSETTKEEVAVNYAFVDGSFNSETNVYGFGGFLMHDGVKEILMGSGNEEEMASMRNVAGEVLGSMAAIKRAIELGLDEVTIYYDYMGIEMWATGKWKRNKVGTIAYYDFVQEAKEKILIKFVKVKGHSGVEGNEEADALAKEAAGIENI